MNASRKHPQNSGQELIADYPQQSLFYVIANEAYQMQCGHRTNIVATTKQWRENDCVILEQRGFAKEAQELKKLCNDIDWSSLWNGEVYEEAKQIHTLFMGLYANQCAIENYFYSRTEVEAVYVESPHVENYIDNGLQELLHSFRARLDIARGDQIENPADTRKALDEVIEDLDNLLSIREN